MRKFIKSLLYIYLKITCYGGINMYGKNIIKCEEERMNQSNHITSSYSLTEEITDLVRERILKGTYKIGEKIKESQIAEEFDVSRTPIREAFKNLEMEGLIDYIPNRGCFAKGFTKRDIEDIYLIRKALEVLAVEWATLRISDEQIKELENQCDMMEFYTIKEEGEKAHSTNAGFHEVIYRATGSRFMAQALRSYKTYIDETRKVVFYNKEYLNEVLSEHREILEAIKARDVEGAKEAMANHLDGSKRRAELVYKL